MTEMDDAARPDGPRDCWADPEFVGRFLRSMPGERTNPDDLDDAQPILGAIEDLYDAERFCVDGAAAPMDEYPELQVAGALRAYQLCRDIADGTVTLDELSTGDLRLLLALHHAALVQAFLHPGRRPLLTLSWVLRLARVSRDRGYARMATVDISRRREQREPASKTLTPSRSRGRHGGRSRARRDRTRSTRSSAASGDSGNDSGGSPPRLPGPSPVDEGEAVA